MPRLSQEIPGPPTCSFCGSTTSDRYVGGYGNHICRECIEYPHLSEAVPRDSVCALCHVALTDRDGQARSGTVIVACRQGLVMCGDCLRVAREILTEVSAQPEH
jgi:hypothetical protein